MCSCMCTYAASHLEICVCIVNVIPWQYLLIGRYSHGTKTEAVVSQHGARYKYNLTFHIVACTILQLQNQFQTWPFHCSLHYWFSCPSWCVLWDFLLASLSPVSVTDLGNPRNGLKGGMYAVFPQFLPHLLPCVWVVHALMVPGICIFGKISYV